MADFKFTQTGAEIQAILNKADGLPTHLYRHSFRLVAASGAAIYVNIYTTSSTAFTLATLQTYLQNNNGLIAGCGYVMDGNEQKITAILSNISYSSNSVMINGYNLTGDTSYSQAATSITSYTPVQVY